MSDQVLLRKNLNMTSIKSFTQEQINHHKIAYIPPSDEIGPNPLYLQFIFSVKDKDNNVVPGQIFNITILPVNNQVRVLPFSLLLKIFPCSLFINMKCILLLFFLSYINLKV